MIYISKSSFKIGEKVITYSQGPLSTYAVADVPTSVRHRGAAVAPAPALSAVRAAVRPAAMGPRAGARAAIVSPRAAVRPVDRNTILLLEYLCTTNFSKLSPKR